MAANAPPAWRSIVAGSMAGTASILVCHPMDTVRTRLQTNRELKGVIDCVRMTIASEGVRGLYKGMSFPLCAQGVYKAVMFYTFGAVSSHLRARRRGDGALALHEIAIAGGCAGGVNSMVVTPVELVRNRLMVQYSGEATKKLYTGPFDALRKVIKADGTRGLWRGLQPTLMRDIPGVSCWYFGFEYSLRSIVSLRAARTSVDAKKIAPTFGERLLAGASGGVCFWTVALPFDAIKSVIQTNSAGKLSVLQCAKRLWREGGFLGFYRGAPVAFGRGIPGAAVTFATFGEAMKRLS